MLIKDLFDFLPKPSRPASYGKKEGKYPFFTSSNIIDKYIDVADYDGEYLIIGDGGTANCKYYSGAFSASDHNYILKPLDGTNCKLIRYFLMKDNYKILSEGFKGVGIKNVSKTYIQNIKFSRNNAYADDEIVWVLSKIEQLIASKNKELLYLDDLIKSRYIEMFGLLETPTKNFTKDILKNLCEKITDGKHGGCTTEMGTGRYFVGAREIYDDAVHYDTAPEISLSEFEKDYKRCNVEIGDFLIVNTGATIGKSAIAVDQRTEFTLLQKSVALLKVKREILNPVFLQYCYKVNDSIYKVDSASAQPNLLLSKIKSTEIYVPPIDLQNEFATFVEQTKKLQISIQKEIDLYNELLEKKMNEYFG